MKSIGSILRICPLLVILYNPLGISAGFSCLSNPCLHGVCLDGLNTTYSCYCIDGYTGVQCQTNWDECWSSPCQNGGVCYDGIASFNCSCPAGFVGDACEENYNECESNPCLNNATCLDVTNGYTCNCLPGYSGSHCEIDIAVCDATNETRCANGGVCVEGPGFTFSCQCPAGWNGFLCDKETDECMSSPCQNGAICIDMHADYSCACLFGFTGRNCEQIVMVCEDNPCRNGALCLMEAGHPACYCVPDYHGEWCQYQYDECQLGPRCMNGGSCIDGVDTFTCSCPPRLTGLYCECLILEDGGLDCTYIRPTIDYATTKRMQTTFSSFPTTDFTTFEVPNITSFWTEFTTFVENVTKLETTIISTEITKLSTNDTTTVESTTELSSSPTTEFTTESTTEYKTESTIQFKTDSTTELTTKLITEFAQSTTENTSFTTKTIPTTTEFSTTEIISTETEPYSTELTFLNLTETTYFPTIFDTTIKEISTQEQSSEFVPITSTLFTTFSSVTTEFESTSQMQSSTIPVSTFFTDEPTFLTDLTTNGETSTENATVGYPDCTKIDNKCQNGGTCTFTSDGYRCICPFDADGTLCQKHLGIQNAAFGGRSFLTHRLVNQSHTTLAFKAKTLASTGLIFYTNLDTSYMALYLENGYLKFKFSCGFQTMLLSEVEVPVNNGFEMTVKTELKFSKDNKHCEAFINVNDTLSMSGDQIASINLFAKQNFLLHLGGIPDEAQKDGLPYIGFVGCMKELEISGKQLLIFKDAADGMEVSECSSLACLSNPCGNGATCSAKGEDWYCHCKNGYVGKMCDTSICDNNPCQFGGTCLPFTGSGYICLCPYGKHGHFCENDLEISRPFFSSSIYGYSSYVAYPLPAPVSNKLEIKFKFSPSTMDQIAILMFIGQKGQHNFHSDHVVVSFVKGYIMLTWNLGSGPRRIFTTKPIKPEENSYSVHIGRTGRRAWLYVENLGNITGRSPGNLVQLDVMPLLYIGGHDSRNFTTLPHDLPLHSGFAGCIYDVEFKSSGLVIPLAESKYAIGRALGQCGTTECYDKICQNGGACLYHGGTFTCLCQDGYFGPMCSTRYNLCDTLKSNCSLESSCVPLIGGYECDCLTGNSGKFCENDIAISDVSFSGIRSFLSLDPVDLDSIKFNIDFELRPLSDRGLVLYIGRRDFLSVFIHSGLLELRIQPSRHKIVPSDVISLRSNKLLVLGNWHKVSIGMYGRKIYLFVDSIVTTAILNSGDILSLSEETVYLGGLPDMSELPNEAISSNPICFTGCIRQFHINSIKISLTSATIKKSRNIADCDGTPCGGEYCENGGSCWLDPSLKPHCSCPEPYFGERCQEIPSCDEKPCQNNGKCFKNRCTCTVGWSGAFCESSITVKTPKFAKDSYIIISKRYDKKRDLNYYGTKSIFLNFTTASHNGLILWTQKGDNYIGIGLEHGHIKVVYSLGDYDEILEVLDIPKISDGLWHSLEITLNPFTLKLDRKEIDVQTETETSKGFFTSDGTFYLGGLPTNTTQKKITAVFPENFEGCIAEFGFDPENIIKDFSRYQGENVDVCNIV